MAEIDLGGTNDTKISPKYAIRTKSNIKDQYKRNQSVVLPETSKLTLSFSARLHNSADSTANSFSLRTDRHCERNAHKLNTFMWRPKYVNLRKINSSGFSFASVSWPALPKEDCSQQSRKCISRKRPTFASVASDKINESVLETNNHIDINFNGSSEREDNNRDNECTGKIVRVPNKTISNEHVTPQTESRLTKAAQRKAKALAKSNAKKEAKRHLIEQQKLKELYGPKDQHVKLIDPSVIDKYLSKPTTESKTSFDPEKVELDFPALGKENLVQRQSLKLNSEEVDKSDGQVSQVNLDKSPKRKPKKHEPIKLNLFNVLKDIDYKLENQQEPSRSTKSVSEQISGNPLDSSNPSRKRGKVREFPKPKRLSQMKELVLKNRAQRKCKCQLKQLFASRIQEQTLTDTDKSEYTSNIHNGSPDLLNRKTKIIDANEDNINFCGDEISKLSLCEDLNRKEEDLVDSSTIKQDASSSLPNILSKTDICDASIQYLSILNSTGTLVNEQFVKIDAKIDDLEGNSKTVCFEEVNTAESPATLCHPSEVLSCFPLTLEMAAKELIHGTKFQEYCDHFTTENINSLVQALLGDIVRFHDNQFHRDPEKANRKRRHVTGLREVKKYAKVNKLKLVVIAPDLEKVLEKGGTFDVVDQIKEAAAQQNVPCVFALTRKKLGKVLHKKVPVSCVGVFSYEGTEKNFQNLMTALCESRKTYNKILEEKKMILSLTTEESTFTKTEETVPLEDVNTVVIKSLLSKLTDNESQSRYSTETVGGNPEEDDAFL